MDICQFTTSVISKRKSLWALYEPGFVLHWSYVIQTVIYIYLSNGKWAQVHMDLFFVYILCCMIFVYFTLTATSSRMMILQYGKELVFNKINNTMKRTRSRSWEYCFSFLYVNSTKDINLVACTHFKIRSGAGIRVWISVLNLKELIPFEEKLLCLIYLWTVIQFLCWEL